MEKYCGTDLFRAELGGLFRFSHFNYRLYFIRHLWQLYRRENIVGEITMQSTLDSADRIIKLERTA